MHACGLVVVCVVVIVFVDVAADVVVMIVTDAIIIVVAAGLVIAVCPCIDCIRLLNMKIVRATTGFSHRWEENGVVIILEFGFANCDTKYVNSFVLLLSKLLVELSLFSLSVRFFVFDGGDVA